MQKIPTLFKREFKNHQVVSVFDEITPGMEWVLAGEGIATEKFDGACCAIINGVFYRRYDAKKGKKPPENAIPCCDPDPITKHWPHWIPVDFDLPENKWFVEAYQLHCMKGLDGTYEVIGPHFQGNPYKLKSDILVRHGCKILEDVPRNFDGIKEYLHKNNIEGIVFWKNGKPQCKIKRSDFGFKWPEY